MPHECLDFWGAPADDLLAMLEPRGDAFGDGWARHLDERAAYDALHALLVELRAALGRAHVDVVEYADTYLITSETIAARSLLTFNGLLLDHFSGAHDPLRSDWLLDPVTTPAAGDKADKLYRRVREALDAAGGGMMRLTAATPSADRPAELARVEADMARRAVVQPEGLDPRVEELWNQRETIPAPSA